MIRYASVCAGIEAASVAWHPLGWTPVWFSEIAPFPCAVLAHHYPTVPNLGDMTRIGDADLDRAGPIDLLVGGTPCQSFSVAGLRKGMADPRGNLALEFLRLLDRTRARWVVWENVPGVLSSAGGRDFGAFLGALGELGYGWAYRVLDAQYFGVAQRRRRVFVVGHAGDWRRAAAVLFERSSLRGDPAPRREAGAGVAGALDGGAHGGGFGDNGARAGKCVAIQDVRGMNKSQNGSGIGGDVAYTIDTHATQGVAHALACHMAKGGDPTTDNYVAHALRATGFDASEDGTGRGTPLVAATLTSGGHPNSNAPGRRKEDDVNIVAFNWQSGGDGRGLDPRATAQLQRCQTPATVAATGVRRLTPTECERLQGFPDGYTLVPYRNKPAADGPRYQALGNSMAVPVVRWIGERIAAVEGVAP